MLSRGVYEESWTGHINPKTKSIFNFSELVSLDVSTFMDIVLNFLNKDVLKGDGAVVARKSYRGTSADLRISTITESAVTPSSSASARNVKR